MTLLADGRVLLMGGFTSNDEPTATTEIYDPRSDTWSRAASLPPPEGEGYTSDHSFLAARLSTGRVLVVGGYRDAQADTWTTYDPSTKTWSTRQSLPSFLGRSDRYRMSALSDGRILLMGCTADGARGTAGIYGPGGWTSAAAPRFCEGAPALRGAVLADSGGLNRFSSAGRYFEPAANSRVDEPQVAQARYFELIYRRVR